MRLLALTISALLAAPTFASSAHATTPADPPRPIRGVFPWVDSQALSPLDPFQREPILLRAQSAVVRHPPVGIASSCTITDLGSLGGGDTDARDMNERGQVVGVSATASGEFDAFLWQRGVMIDLGALGESGSEARHVNGRGQVIGVSATAAGESHAFLWQNGVMTDLGTLGGRGSWPSGVNERGQVVGVSLTPSGAGHPFLWEDGVMTDLGTLGGAWSEAVGVNDRGQVMGASQTMSGSTHAFLWQDGTMTDLGTLGGTDSYPYDMNERGQVVGWSLTASGAEHPFLWQDGMMNDLGTLGGQFSFAYRVNDRGQVVGGSETEASIDGFLWENGVMAALGSGEWGLAINDEGQVAGDGFVWRDGIITELNGSAGEAIHPIRIDNRGQVLGIEFSGAHDRSVLCSKMRPNAPLASQVVSSPTFGAQPASSRALHAGAPASAMHITSMPGVAPVEFETTGLPRGVYTASVFDVQGRLIRRWQGFAAPSGRDSWDGKRGGGAAASSGMYFLRVEASGVRPVAKILVAR